MHNCCFVLYLETQKQCASKYQLNDINRSASWLFIQFIQFPTIIFEGCFVSICFFGSWINPQAWNMRSTHFLFVVSKYGFGLFDFKMQRRFEYCIIFCTYISFLCIFICVGYVGGRFSDGFHRLMWRGSWAAVSHKLRYCWRPRRINLHWISWYGL